MKRFANSNRVDLVLRRLMGRDIRTQQSRKSLVAVSALLQIPDAKHSALMSFGQEPDSPGHASPKAGFVVPAFEMRGRWEHCRSVAPYEKPGKFARPVWLLPEVTCDFRVKRPKLPNRPLAAVRSL